MLLASQSVTSLSLFPDVTTTDNGLCSSGLLLAMELMDFVYIVGRLGTSHSPVQPRAELIIEGGFSSEPTSPSFLQRPASLSMTGSMS